MSGSAPESAFGACAPGKAAIVLRGITRLGISRGMVRKWVLRQWRKLGIEFVDVTVRGVNFRLDVRRNATDGRILTSSKVYDREEIARLACALTATDAAFVDVGANTGYYSLNLARQGCFRIIAIEPNPPTLQLLRFNVQANDLGSRITIVPLAAGSGEDVPFYCPGSLGSASVFSDWRRSEPIVVHSKPILAIMQEQGVERIGGMKVDIEGFEDQVLFPFFASAPRSLWPSVVVIEVCHAQCWKNDIVEHMKALGYLARKRTRGNQILELAPKATPPPA